MATGEGENFASVDVGPSAAAEDVEMMPKDPPGVRFSFRTFIVYAGPGWLMSLAYLDPGNLESDLQSGAYTGYNLVWVLFLCTVAGLILQILAARLGTVTGRNLAQSCRAGYARKTYLTIWIMTEIAIIGSDVQEVVGTAIAFKTLFGWPLWFGSIFTGLDTFTFLAIHYFGKRILELFIFSLVMVMMVCYFTNFTFNPPPFSDLVSGFEFHCPDYAILQLVGTVGAVIMPHNIYLHSALVQSRGVDRTDPEHLSQANKYNMADCTVALFFSFLINGALLSAFANGFFVDMCARADGGPFACVPSEDGQGDGSTACVSAEGLHGFCGEIGLDQGGDALQILYGSYGVLGQKLFALGVLAAGQASTMTGTFAGQFVMEGFLAWTVPIWVRTLITRSIALGPAVVVALLTSDNPNLNNTVNQWLNILQSVQLPFALLPVLHFCSDRPTMGDFTLRKRYQAVCWALALIVIGVNVYLVVDNIIGSPWWAWVLAFVCFIAYGFFLTVMIRSDLQKLAAWLTSARAPDAQARPLTG